MKHIRGQRNLLRIGFFLAVFVPAGCEMEGFDPNVDRAAPGVISSYREWTLTAHGGEFRNLRAAVDGSQLTAAVSGRNYGNAVVTLDLGRSCYFNCVAMIHGDHPDGYPRQVSLATSHDGRTYTHQRTVYGTRKITYILLEQPVRARYLRFTAVRPGLQPWSIAEIFLQ